MVELNVVNINLIRSSFRIHFPPNGVLQVLDPPQGNLEFVLDSQGLRLGHLQLLLQVGFLVGQLELPGLHVGHFLSDVSEGEL